MASLGPTSATTMRIALEPTSMTAIISLPEESSTAASAPLRVEAVRRPLGGPHHDRMVSEPGDDDFDRPGQGRHGIFAHASLGCARDKQRHGFDQPTA